MVLGPFQTSRGDPSVLGECSARDCFVPREADGVVQRKEGAAVRSFNLIRKSDSVLRVAVRG